MTPNWTARVAGAARDALDRHRERHRPSGFAITIADRIAGLDDRHWDAVTAACGGVFMARPYLTALEESAPETLVPRYALLFRDGRPVAAVHAQILRLQVHGDVPSPARASRLTRGIGAVANRIRSTAASHTRLLVCGNVFAWGCHGVAMLPDEDQSTLWPGVADVLYRIRRAERLAGRCDLVVVKDLPQARRAELAALSRYSYRPCATDPDMVLDLPPEWTSYADYLASLAPKYRKAAVKLGRDGEAGGYVVEPLMDVAGHADVLHALYLQVHRRAKVRPARVTASYLPALARALGDGFRCTVVRDASGIVGFVTTIRDGATAVGYLLGYDADANRTAPIYLRLLQAVVADAIALGCRRLSLGRTALEPKARLGARPEPQEVWVRHRLPMANVLLRGVLSHIPHDEPPERNPFA